MWLYGFGKGLIGLVFRTIYRIEVEGAEHIPQTGGVILCGNHFDAKDPMVAGITATRPVSFMAKAEIFTRPVIGTVARGLGAFPVKRGTADRSSLKKAIDILTNGGCFGIFPEGTRSRDRQLKKPEPGTAYIALKAKVPVIPFGITSEYKLFGPVKIRFGPPVDLERFQGAKLTQENLEAASHEIAAAIGSLLEPPVFLPPAAGEER